ncbi:MAG: glycosyltransferase family 2 protein [Ignavibacteriaceae bacterium]
MSKKITVFLPYNEPARLAGTKLFVKELQSCGLVTKIFLLSRHDCKTNIAGTEILKIENPFGSETINLIKGKTETDYILFLTQDTLIEPGQFSLERFLNIAEISGAGLVYSDYTEIRGEERKSHPVIDYQPGSIRDDFNFGPLLFISKESIKNYESYFDYKFAGLYDLRLFISRGNSILRIPEFLYSTVATDSRKSGEKLFDYVNPKNREVQIEMEKAATEHLKTIGAYLYPPLKAGDQISFDDKTFRYEASVIIPVKNRVKTIGDAVQSVLNQKTNFSFNLLIVDNYSTDGTTDLIRGFADKDGKVFHLIPARKDLGIGGCWNEAVHHNECGKFSVQLDSDDIYQDENSLQIIVDTFMKEKCAMVIGSYTLTDFKLNELPPGIIDHREWTPENGRNNALRINGLGAPRAYYTPVVRNIKIPNVSYGEDYAIGLAISRNYKIGRIYDSIYFCRRWEDNSDAALSIEKQNIYNTYKDRIRTIEIMARQKKNLSGSK